MGFNIPETLITNDVDKVSEFFESCHGLMLYKSVTTGHLSSVSAKTQLMTYSRKIEATDLSKMVLVKNCPGMFQKYIEKEHEIKATPQFLSEIGNIARANSETRSQYVIDFTSEFFSSHSAITSAFLQCFCILSQSVFIPR